jgi:hypothetical protein
MGTTYGQHSIGDTVVAISSVLPQSITVSGAVNGSSIDRLPRKIPLTCLLHQSVGTISGSPTALTISTVLQHSPDGTSWQNYLAPNLSGNQAVLPNLTAANTENSLSIDLSSAMRFIRAVTTVNLSGATSAIVQADIMIAGEPNIAAV